MQFWTKEKGDRESEISKKVGKLQVVGKQEGRGAGQGVKPSPTELRGTQVPLTQSYIARGLWEESGVHSECLNKGGQECSIETCYSHPLSLVKGNPQIVDLGVEVKESTSYSLTRTLLPRVLKQCTGKQSVLPCL